MYAWKSGDCDVLKYVNKGVTNQELTLAGKKAKEAGFELSLYWMPGLGGRSMTRQHAVNTAKALNEINQDFVRTRRLVPRRGPRSTKSGIGGLQIAIAPRRAWENKDDGRALGDYRKSLL
jgi:radical SAM superfamily enzyme YgiQ (UPF0313 family)